MLGGVTSSPRPLPFVERGAGVNIEAPHVADALCVVHDSSSGPNK